MRSVTCPACAKKNEATDTCARCGCDLSALRGMLSAALSHLSLAKRELQQGDGAAALAQAQRSWALVHSAQSAQIACLAGAALGDTEVLARWRRRVAG